MVLLYARRSPSITQRNHERNKFFNHEHSERGYRTTHLGAR